MVLPAVTQRAGVSPATKEVAYGALVILEVNKLYQV